MSEEEPDPLKPESWHAVPNVCGSCIAWRPDASHKDDELATGVCKLRPEIGRVPADLRKCSQYLPRGQFVYQPGKAPGSPKRRAAKTVSVLRQSPDGALVRSTVRADALPASMRPREDDEEAEVQSAPRAVRPPAPSTIDLGTLSSTEVARYALIELVRQEHGRSRRELHPRFKGGKVVADSGAGLTRTVPAERFFSMLDRLRSSLDALDQALGAQAGTLGAEAAELRGQVARMHGSMTTFNVLFSDREDYFSSKE
jgi:hypothetical protein